MINKAYSKIHESEQNLFEEIRKNFHIGKTFTRSDVGKQSLVRDQCFQNMFFRNKPIIKVNRKQYRQSTHEHSDLTAMRNLLANLRKNHLAWQFSNIFNNQPLSAMPATVMGNACGRTPSCPPPDCTSLMLSFKLSEI